MPVEQLHVRRPVYRDPVQARSTTRLVPHADLEGVSLAHSLDWRNDEYVRGGAGREDKCQAEQDRRERQSDGRTATHPWRLQLMAPLSRINGRKALSRAPGSTSMGGATTWRPDVVQGDASLEAARKPRGEASVGEVTFGDRPPVVRVVQRRGPAGSAGTAQHRPARPFGPRPRGLPRVDDAGGASPFACRRSVGVDRAACCAGRRPP